MVTDTSLTQACRSDSSIPGAARHHPSRKQRPGCHARSPPRGGLTQPVCGGVSAGDALATGQPLRSAYVGGPRHLRSAPASSNRTVDLRPAPTTDDPRSSQPSTSTRFATRTPATARGHSSRRPRPEAAIRPCGRHRPPRRPERPTLRGIPPRRRRVLIGAPDDLLIRKSHQAS